MAIRGNFVRTHAAFTLIELLVVVSVIALLVSILIPALSVAKEQATGAICLSRQRALITAWVMYADENEDKIVFGKTYNNQDTWVEVQYDTSHESRLDAIRRGALYPYLETAEVYNCPAGGFTMAQYGRASKYLP